MPNSNDFSITRPIEDSLRAELEQLKAERDWHSVGDGDNLTRCLCFLGISIERYSVLGHQHWPTPEFQRAVRHVLAEMSDFGRKLTADNVELRAENAALREALTWRTIESAPKDGRRILAWGKLGSFHVVKWSSAYEEWSEPGRGVGGLSHWQSLPEPPKE